ncbi:sensor histidine kinase [Nocardia sp. 2YAB30]|uniref:sensor histidine kinase n=1 Tax=Nocardia sp. 2YAB30 TaxID=3233022 RepID=UPI003F9741F2
MNAQSGQSVVVSPGLATGSLRRRMVATSVMVLIVVVIKLGVVMNAGFGVASDRGLEAVLTDRFRLAHQLAEQRVKPEELVERVEVGSIWARLTLADGAVFGSLDQTRTDGVAVKLRQGQLPATSPLFQGAHLTLGVYTGPQADVHSRMILFTVVAGAVAIVLAVLASSVTVGIVLAPLDAIAHLARDISRGGRGRRLAPTRTDTEIGRVAIEFDGMLDSLEGAEAAARAAEEHTRRFVADAVHELRTPITGIRAVAEAVLAQPTDGDRAELQRLHMLMVRETHRAGQLIEDLLDVARLDAGGIELYRRPSEVLALAMEQADRVRLLHPGLDITVIAEDAVVAYADPIRVTQILANLLDNACRATPVGGRVRVVGTDQAGGVEVVVSDTGPGVPIAERERVFDRMVRLDSSRDRTSGGSGLGLTIARGLARAHGGDLTCDEPIDGVGALFRLRLPAAAKKPDRPAS